MRFFEEAVAALVRDTAVENDETEQARLKRLSLEEQLEIAFVLHEAMKQARLPNGAQSERLSGMRSIADAQRVLDSN
ncbi:MAG TPA: hypothetical protein VNA27_09090 [Rubrobacteraceae bacterium]|nr:hypothetical protein [Rubrobacteraceae bacterium]